MANELNIQLDPFLETGLTLTAKVFNKSGTQEGSDVSMTETSTGFYSGDFALGAIADGDYIVKFQTTTEFYGSGTLKVKDGAEFEPSDLTATDVATELNTYDAPTKAELDAAQASIEADIAALNDVSTADVQTASAAALVAYDPPTKAELDSAVSPLATQESVDVIDSNVDDIKSKTDTLITYEPQTEAI